MTLRTIEICIYVRDTGFVYATGRGGGGGEGGREGGREGYRGRVRLGAYRKRKIVENWENVRRKYKMPRVVKQW